MRALQRIAAVAVAVAGLLAAPPAARAQASAAYFPMQNGNEWTYKETGFAPSANPRVVRIDSRWVSGVTGYVYYRFRELNGNYHWLTRLPRTSRIGEYGTGFWYHLDERVGSAWSFKIDTSGTHGSIACSSGAQVRVHARAEQLTVPAGTFSTIHLTWRTTCFDAGITDEWFAENVGLVKRSQSTIGGPRNWELVSAKVNGRTIGQSPAARLVQTVTTGQDSYWENHMPGPGPRPTEGPEISVTTLLRSSDGRASSYNTPDFNSWDIQVIAPNGNVVWINPKSRAMAPPGGVDRPVPAAGERITHTFRLPFGSEQGRYRVSARCLATKPHTFTAVETSFDYGWAF